MQNAITVNAIVHAFVLFSMRLTVASYKALFLIGHLDVRCRKDAVPASLYFSSVCSVCRISRFQPTVST